MIKFLRDVEPNKKCVCVFTNKKKLQKNLHLRSKGVSESGVWKLSKEKMARVSKVVIYYRHDGINEIIVGDYLKMHSANDPNYPNRYCLDFVNIRRDQTMNDWKVFCQTGSNPVKYL